LATATHAIDIGISFSFVQSQNCLQFFDTRFFSVTVLSYSGVLTLREKWRYAKSGAVAENMKRRVFLKANVAFFK